MSPTHTKKGNRRYRYYLSQALLQFKKDQAGSVTRVSANNIEPLVTRHLLAQLSNAHALLSLIDTRNLSADQQAVLIKNGESLSNQWSTLERTQKITYIQAIIHKIIVSKERLTVQIKTVSLREILLGGKDERPDRIKGTESQPIFATQYIPVQLQRCGIETRLVITNGEYPTAHQGSVKALQVALLKALKWNQALMNGDAETLVELANRDKVNPRYVNYLLPRAYLAPDIMSSIVKGNIPSTFTLETLKKGLPIDWQDQRKRFFNPS